MNKARLDRENQRKLKYNRGIAQTQILLKIQCRCDNWAEEGFCPDKILELRKENRGRNKLSKGQNISKANTCSLILPKRMKCVLICLILPWHSAEIGK